ncbi:hypothetical protein DENSPDRAFT_499440 [Dentipellis sp. KUC8613]|nr:hypothetical protein DENSPDRAFT_499440 [Dentipellis sp. KUC8613]
MRQSGRPALWHARCLPRWNAQGNKFQRSSLVCDGEDLALITLSMPTIVFTSCSIRYTFNGLDTLRKLHIVHPLVFPRQAAERVVQPRGIATLWSLVAPNHSGRNEE